MLLKSRRNPFTSSGFSLGVVLVSLLFLSLACPRSHAASVTLAWDPNTEPDIAGYKLYYGSPVGNYTSLVDVGHSTNTTVPDLESGLTYAFYVTCYNTSGLESEPSNVVEYTVPSSETVNHAPLALTAALNARPGQEITIPLRAEDPDGDPLSFNFSSFPKMGEITGYAVNGDTSATVTYVAPADWTGRDEFTFNATDGYETSTDAKVFIRITSNQPGSGSGFLVGIEAESAALLPPMNLGSDEAASSGEFIATSTSNEGAATLPFSIPVEGDYVVWCRVRTPSAASDSFVVTLDNDPTTTDIYDASAGVYNDEWHWMPLTGRGGLDQPYPEISPLPPRIFHLAAGAHSLTFEGRENETGLDALVITADKRFDAAAASAAKITRTVISAEGGLLIEWPAFPGLTYQLFYQTNTDAGEWTPIPQTITATTTLGSYLDTATAEPRRFYHLEILP